MSKEIKAIKRSSIANELTKYDMVLPDDLPIVSGYRLLVMPLKAREKTKGGVIITDVTKEADEYAAQVAIVLDMGPAAYADVDKYGPEPWCGIGSWVLLAKYSGKWFNYKGSKFKIINDDEVLGVVTAPEDVTR